MILSVKLKFSYASQQTESPNENYNTEYILKTVSLSEQYSIIISGDWLLDTYQVYAL
jgi:hypothetical protein